MSRPVTSAADPSSEGTALPTTFDRRFQSQTARPLAHEFHQPPLTRAPAPRRGERVEQDPRPVLSLRGR